MLFQSLGLTVPNEILDIVYDQYTSTANTELFNSSTESTMKLSISIEEWVNLVENRLNQELKNANTIIQKQSQEIEVLKKQYETLKITSALLGSEENKRDTKLKINSLIREIDYCIAQLSD